MVDWNSVLTAHVRQALAEGEQVGPRDFQSRYNFGRAHDASLWHGGQEYDAHAVAGHAFLSATGSTIPREEFDNGGEDGAVLRLRALGFDVVVDETLSPPPRAPRATTTTTRASSPRTPREPRATAVRTPKAPPAPKRVVMKGRDSTQLPESKICPTCFMALPATGVCDNCD